MRVSDPKITGGSYFQSPQNHNHLSSLDKGYKKRAANQKALFPRMELWISGIYKELVWPAIKIRPKATNVLSLCMCVLDVCMHDWQSGRCWHDKKNTLHTFSALTLLGFTTWIEQQDFKESFSHKVSFNVGVCDIMAWDVRLGRWWTVYLVWAFKSREEAARLDSNPWLTHKWKTVQKNITAWGMI